MLYTEDRHIFELLLFYKKVDLYSLYLNSGFSTGQISRFIKTYGRKLYIVKFNKVIYLTPYGLYKLRKTKLITSENDRYWRKIPDDYIQTPIAKNYPFNELIIKKGQVRGIISKEGCSRPEK